MAFGVEGACLEGGCLEWDVIGAGKAACAEAAVDDVHFLRHERRPRGIDRRQETEPVQIAH
jgi:hypothetical protein